MQLDLLRTLKLAHTQLHHRQLGIYSTEGFRFIGDWNEDSANQHYKVGEVVRLGGFTYVCILDHEEGQQPPNTAYWKQINEGFRWRGEWVR